MRHSPHAHAVDPEGSDTDRFVKAGAQGSGLVTADRTNFFITTPRWQDKISQLTNVFHDCHLVLIEGGIAHGREKIETVPEGETLLCEADQGLVAVVGRSCSVQDWPCFVPDDITGIGDFIEEKYLKPLISGAVLAGGKSSRLGRNKAFLELQGKTIIEWVLKNFSAFVSLVKIITNNPEEYVHLGLETSRDIRPGGGPLSGIHTALSVSPTEYVLALSCDIPLVGPEQLRRLLCAYPGNDITIFKHKNFEPLCAVYRRTCITALEELIDHGEYRIIDLFPTLNVKVIRIDDGDIFRSINTEDDFQYIVKNFSG